MRAKIELLNQLKQLVTELGYNWPEKVTIEPPKDKKFGDLAVNIAMLLARESGKNPRELAAGLAQELKKRIPEIVTIEIAGPGFLNIRYSDDFWRETVSIINQAGPDYGRSNYGAGKKVQIEFVSANPTGPLHIGHGRGAAVGDSMARIMRFAGYETHAEYYINDAGNQMQMLGISVYLRAKELQKEAFDWPEHWYKGEYIIDIARELLAQTPGLLQLPYDEGIGLCYKYALQVIIKGIKADLSDFRVNYDNWFSEKTLVTDGSVEQAFKKMKEAGYTYEQDGALWFKATDFGDDKDRVLRKSDGSLTYFASDIAYHNNKFERGFDLLVDVWGADHHGYIPRMRAAVSALGKPAETFEVILVQLVNLMQGGELVAMSTRAGKFETLTDVVRDVGTDAARFMFLSRKSDSPLDFDLDLVKQRSLENPVYYVQYAHARICAVLRKAEERNINLAKENLENFNKYLTEEAELSILRKLDQFSELVSSSAATLAPHHISFYLQDLAKELHAYYSRFQVLNLDDNDIILSRLGLLSAIRQVLCNGLGLLGVNAPESM